jgi:hypothetical protein
MDSPVNIYGYTFSVSCPSDPTELSEYTLLIRHDEMIKAEDIVDACGIIGPKYHEEIADIIRKKLPGKQSISAEHCGVEIITER